MDISKIYNYYPETALTDLSDCYKEDNFTTGDRICIISYLGIAIRVSQSIRIKNKYVLFLENTPSVTSIAWSYTLFNDQDITTDTAALTETKNQNEYLLEFRPTLFDANKELRFNRLAIQCKVTKGADVKTLELYHSLVPAVNVDSIFDESQEHKAFLGNADTTNFLVNYLKECITGSVTWNNLPVNIGGLGEDSLINYAASLLYYQTHTYFDDAELNNTYYDLARHDNREIENLIINDQLPDDVVNPNNGICGIPLHLLSDCISDFTLLPDFLNISATNKIFEILSRPVVFGPTPDGTTLNDAENTRLLKESRQRLIGQKVVFDGKKLLNLYNLTRFPKSSVKLACILLKFLFEASKKNNCQECLYKQIAWKFLNIDGLKSEEDFRKNIFSHYWDGPVNKVLKFSQRARTCAQYVWSPFIYTIVHFPPRIISAYFAKKRVVKKGADLTCFFQRIDSKHKQKDANGIDLPYDAIMGREVFLVIETLDLQDKEITCELIPSTSTMTGNTNRIKVMVNNAEVEEIKTTVGFFQALRPIVGLGVLEYTNMARDHKDKAFVKLYLRPAARATYDAWSLNVFNSIAENRMVNLEIFTKLSVPGEVYFGESGPHGLSARFLNSVAKGQFRVAIRTFYEVFEKDNLYNFLNLGGGDFRIGKIKNDNGDQVVFYYHDAVDQEHHICQVSMFTPFHRENGVRVNVASNPVNIPAGSTGNAPAPAGGDADTNYFYANNDIVTRGHWPAVGHDFGIIRYSATVPNRTTEIVRMVDAPNISFTIDATTVRITYSFVATFRRFASPACYAAFIGILAELSYANVQSTGMCFEDATSYPSVTHPNGDSIDMTYLESLVKKRAIISALKDWGFGRVISSGADVDGADVHDPVGHATHLHAGDFPDANVLVIL